MDGSKAVKRKKIRYNSKDIEGSESDEEFYDNKDFIVGTVSNPENINTNKKNKELKKYTSEQIASNSKGNENFKVVNNNSNKESEEIIAKKKRLEKLTQDSFILEREFNSECSSDHHIKCNSNSSLFNDTNRIDLVKVESEIKNESNGNIMPGRNLRNKINLSGIKSESFVNDPLEKPKKKANSEHSKKILNFWKSKEGSIDVDVQKSVSSGLNEKENEKAESVPELPRRRKHHRSVTDAENIVKKIIHQQSINQEAQEDELDEFLTPKKHKHRHHHTAVEDTGEQSNLRENLNLTKVQKIRMYATSDDCNRFLSSANLPTNTSNNSIESLQTVCNSDTITTNEKKRKKHKRRHAKKYDDEKAEIIRYGDDRLEDDISQQSFKNEKIDVLYDRDEPLKSLQSTHSTIKKIVASNVTINIVTGKTCKENIEVDHTNENKTESELIVPKGSDTFKKEELPKIPVSNKEHASQTDFEQKLKNSQVICENTMYKILTITYTNDGDNKHTKVQYTEKFINEKELQKRDEITENKNGWTVTMIEEVKGDKIPKCTSTSNSKNKILNSGSNWLITLGDKENIEHKKSSTTIDINDLGRECWGKLQASLSTVIKSISQKISESKLSLTNKLSSIKTTENGNFAEPEVFLSKSVQTLNNSQTDINNYLGETNVNDWWKSLKDNLTSIVSTISANVERIQEKVSTTEFYKTNEVEKIENCDTLNTAKTSVSSMLEQASEVVKPLTEKISSILSSKESQTNVKNICSDMNSNSVVKNQSNGILKKGESEKKLNESNTNVTFSEKVSTKIIGNTVDDTCDKKTTDEKIKVTECKPSTSTIEKVLSSVIETVKSIVEPSKVSNETENCDKTNDLDEELVAAICRFLNGSENLKTLEDLVVKKNKKLTESPSKNVYLMDVPNKSKMLNSRESDKTLVKTDNLSKEKESLVDIKFDKRVSKTNEKSVEAFDIIKLYLNNNNATNCNLTCNKENSFIADLNKDNSPKLLQHSKCNIFDSPENTNYVDILRHYTRQKPERRHQCNQVKLKSCQNKQTTTFTVLSHNTKKKQSVSLQTQTEIDKISNRDKK